MRISDWSSDVCSSDLRMGHHAEYVSAVIADACDVFDRAVRVGCFGIVSGGIAVAEQDLVVVIQLFQRFGAGVVASLAVGYGDTQRADGIYLRGNQGIGGLYFQEIGRASWRERGCQYV